MQSVREPLAYLPDPWRKPLPPDVVTLITGELARVNNYRFHPHLSFVVSYLLLEVGLDTPVLDALLAVMQPGDVVHNVLAGELRPDRYWMKIVVYMVQHNYYCYATSYWSSAGCTNGKVTLLRELLTRDEDSFYESFSLSHENWHRFLASVYCSTPTQEIAEAQLRYLPVHAGPSEPVPAIYRP